jgi:tRNA dimethylallyltransferase
VLVGPTASGKSSVSIPVARALDAEIVSLDSMSLYRGMDIGTAKPQAEYMDRSTGGVPHHLIDLLDPTERFDTRRYIDSAEAAIADIRARGREVLVVGGTALYLVSLLKGMFEGPPRDADLRTRLAEEEPARLHERLAQVDPAMAERLHPNDRRRITRALEVFELTGRPLSEQQEQWDRPDRFPSRIAGLFRPRDELRARIEARVDTMLATGLVEEVRGLELGPTASQAVGYKEILGHLRGQFDLAEARRLMVRNTGRLARRQTTWFARLPVHWVDAHAPDRVEQLIEFYRGSSVQ